MMLGYDFWGYRNGSVFDSTTSIGKLYRLEISHSTVDELKVDSGFDQSDSSDKESWGYYTLLLAKFQDNLEAGNIQNEGVTIDKIRLKRRKKDDLVWEQLHDFNYDKNIQVYTFDDKYIESNQDYEYAIVPVTVIEGKYTVADISTSFSDTWIIDKDNNYRLIYNINYDDIQHNQKSSVIETLDNQYPTTQFLGDVDYRTGNIQGLLVADTSLNGSIDIKQEKLNRRNILSFLKNKKPKILKDNQNFIIANLINIKEVPNNDLGRQVYGISFDFVECANSDMQSIRDNGLI